MKEEARERMGKEREREREGGGKAAAWGWVAGWQGRRGYLHTHITHIYLCRMTDAAAAAGEVASPGGA